MKIFWNWKEVHVYSNWCTCNSCWFWKNLVLIMCCRHGVSHTDRESDRCCRIGTRCAEESSTEWERLPAYHPLYLLTDPQVMTNTCFTISVRNHSSECMLFVLCSWVRWWEVILVWVGLCSILSLPSISGYFDCNCEISQNICSYLCQIFQMY